MVTTLDPLWKMLEGVPDTKHDKVRRAVAQAAAFRIMKENR